MGMFDSMKGGLFGGMQKQPQRQLQEQPQSPPPPPPMGSSGLIGGSNMMRPSQASNQPFQSSVPMPRQSPSSPMGQPQQQSNRSARPMILPFMRPMMGPARQMGQNQLGGMRPSASNAMTNTMSRQMSSGSRFTPNRPRY